MSAAADPSPNSKRRLRRDPKLDCSYLLPGLDPPRCAVAGMVVLQIENLFPVSGFLRYSSMKSEQPGSASREYLFFFLGGKFK